MAQAPPAVDVPHRLLSGDHSQFGGDNDGLLLLPAPVNLAALRDVYLGRPVLPSSEQPSLIRIIDQSTCDSGVPARRRFLGLAILERAREATRFFGDVLTGAPAP